MDLERLAAHLAPAFGRRAAYLDLADGIRALVLDGQLLAGDRLPPQRALAEALQVSRTTVVAALATLQAEGYLAGRQGSAVTVRLPTSEEARPDEPTPPPGATWPRIELDLSLGVLPAAPQVAGAAAGAAARLAEYLAGPGLHPYGVAELRAAIAARMSARGLRSSPAQILITQGALHGWDLVLRAVARPGTRVLVEQPGYPAALDAVRAHRVRMQPLAVSAAGWEWPAAASRAPAPDLAYVVPDFQNPTGYRADDAARRLLARTLPHTLLCVDETFVDLADAAAPSVTPAACFDPAAVTIGSLSKLVWSGLRVGWLRGPEEFVRRVASVRSSQDIASPILDQLLALELMPELDAISRDRSALLARRRAHAAAAVRAAGWRVRPPAGGMFLWVDVAPLSSTQLSASARERGVRVPPGTRFSISRTHDRYLRFPATGTPEQLTDAISRLALAGADHTTAAGERARTHVWTV